MGTRDHHGLSPDPLHPNGRCTCCGEGRCEWCVETLRSEHDRLLAGLMGLEQTIRLRRAHHKHSLLGTVRRRVLKLLDGRTPQILAAMEHKLGAAEQNVVESRALAWETAKRLFLTREALERFGWHETECATNDKINGRHDTDGVCSCGLEAALAADEAMTQGAGGGGG